jgi:predicted enzyme related to lactoylglutathione lyase
MPRVIHFEIAATDLPRAVSFNKTVFGWDLQKTKLPIEYWLATTGKPTEPGINGAIMPREGAPANIIITISVDSIEDTLKRIEANGGKGITPKAPIPGIGFFCYCQDPEGNIFGILAPAPESKSPPPKKAVKKPKKSKST